MKKLLHVLIFFLAAQNVFSQGCIVTETIPRDTIVCGESIFLTAFGRGQGIALLSENFNTGSYGPGWSATQQAMWNNPCSSGGVDGTTHIWMGNSSPVPRILTTTSFNLSSCTNAGVTICFDLLFAEQGNSAPCEGPDEPQEGIYLQYSINNGATWVDINYFDPNGGNDPQLVNWSNWCFPVPAVALTSNTLFRWFQDADSGADYDHWGIDNVVIYCNDPTYNIVWTHDGYSAGPVGGTNPTPVAPRTTTSYIVVMSNGTVTCRDTVRVVVRNPTIVVNAGNDTTVCNGQCATLNATAKIIQKPAKTPTYTNQEQATITGVPGFPGFPPFIPATPGSAFLNMDINITNLNLNTVQNGYITSVCIGSLNMILFAGVEIFDIWLVCPSGDSILLVRDSTLTGNALTNTCFVPSGSNITSSTSPYTGSFSPNQSFNNLTGCDANGVWSLHFVAVYNGITLPTGFFNNWSISFNDPEIAYTGNFTWNPTTNMTNSNTLTPTVCPPPNTYTITVSDTANCVTLSDAVTVNTQACCGLSATIARVQPTCAGSNGSINVTPVPAGLYSYVWNDGNISQNRTGLAAGNYCVTITDTNTPTCTFDTCITLNSNSTLAVSFTNPVNPTCAGNDGAITATLAGGTAPYTVVVDTGGAPITFPPIPFPISQTIPGLPAGTIDVTVTDAQGCIATATATLTAPTNCCVFTVSAAITQPSCAQTNGSIALTPANGSGNYSYNWSGGLGTTNSISSVGVGTYNVTITDNGFANCFIDTSFTLNSNSTLAVSFTNPVNPTCAGNDGSITVNLAGGTAPYTVVVDTGGAPITFPPIPFPISQAVPGLPAGTVTVNVTDAQGCTATATATLTAPTNCCTFTVSDIIIQPACGQNDGSITLTAANGSGNYSYSWGGGLGTANSISSVAAGNYAVTITDNAYANCFIDTSFLLTNPNGPIIDSFKILNVSCTGNGSDGSASVYASSVNGVNVSTGYTWSNTTLDTDDTQSGLATGTYLFTVTDLAGCSTPGSVTIGLDAGCCFLQIAATVVPPTCGLNNGSITINETTAGTPPYTYSIDGVNYQASNIFTGVASGNYNAITLDAGLCSDTVTVVVPSSSNNLLVTITAADVSCFGANDGTADAVVAGGTIPYSYIWNTNSTSSALTSLTDGNYSVTVTDLSGCSGSASATITEPQQVTVSLGSDTVVCQGQQVTLSITGIYNSYTWSTGEVSPFIIVTDSGSYAITVTDINGCTATDAVEVTAVPSPVVDLGEDKIAYDGDHVGLFANVNLGNANGGTYNWQPDTLLTCFDCQNTVAYAYDTITYVVFYTDPNGCTASDDVTIYVSPIKNIFWPNAFTPNGDGNNDIFIPFGSTVKQISWAAFNRWGEKVFDSNNFFVGWDGYYKGAPAPAGVYVYNGKAVMLNNEERTFKGSFTLIR